MIPISYCLGFRAVQPFRDSTRGSCPPPCHIMDTGRYISRSTAHNMITTICTAVRAQPNFSSNMNCQGPKVWAYLVTYLLNHLYSHDILRGVYDRGTNQIRIPCLHSQSTMGPLAPPPCSDLLSGLMFDSGNGQLLLHKKM